MHPTRHLAGSSQHRRFRESQHVSRLDQRISRKNQCVIVRRDTREKIVVSLDEVNEKLAEVLETMQNDMLQKAKAFLASHINDAHDTMSSRQSQRQSLALSVLCGVETKLREQKSKGHNSYKPLYAVW